MRPFGALLAFKEAKAIVDANIQPITRTESVRLDDAVGRVLAGDLTAKLSVPPFDRAAMDGYAVRAEDTVGAGQRSGCLSYIAFSDTLTHEGARPRDLSSIAMFNDPAGNLIGLVKPHGQAR